AEAEEDRLLYVAGTRARSLLIISDYPARAGQNPWNRLAAGLPELPQLPEAETAWPQSGASRPAPSAEDFHAARLHFLGPAAPSGAPTYAETSITAIVKQGAERPPGLAAGRGVSWGRVVHRLLEELARDGSLDLERLAANLLAEEGRPGEEAAEMARLARDIAASELWRRLRAARRRLVELPFAVKVPAGEQGFPSDTVVTGVVDLVFEEDDGWVLADYKSDAVADEAHLAALADYYAPQVRLYRAFLERQAGIRVKEAGLYFLAAGRWVVIET
ncbi:MAG: PD-(D/E)XK nuclease family protein, partial [Syntrophomonadaceae bacterium]|nr:PD-(D/E)XK nuclease family protein [Syntrophomonadaceae bacterium]